MTKAIHQFERLPQVEAPAAGANDIALAPVRAQPLVGVIRNARSHRNGGETGLAATENVILHTPQRRSELPQILADLAKRRVDCIAIDGGDGTVRDVITCGAGVFGTHWPKLIVLPSGKTNALAHDLGIPVDWTLHDAVKAIGDGRIETRRPMVIAQADNRQAQVHGFVMGGGAFTRAIALGQRSHKLGAFNAAVVGMTTVWSVAQALFGRQSNAWRRGTRMRVRDAAGADLPHLGGLPEHERYLVFASTLRGFPAGLNPFRRVDGPVKLALLDNPRRGLLLRMGALARGTASEATLRRGAHIVEGEAFHVDIGGNFVLDGEIFPAGDYCLTAGEALRFVVP